MKTNNTVVISNKATLTSTGDHFHGNCEPVVAVDLQMAFNSITDLATYCNVSYHAISNVLAGRQNTIGVYTIDENGNRHKIGSTRVKRASEAETILDTIMETGRSTKAENEKLKEENAALNAEMEEFRAWKAEQERIRKAEEKRQCAIAKAKERIERCKHIEQNAQEKYQMAIAHRQNAERELAELEMTIVA